MSEHRATPQEMETTGQNVAAILQYARGDPRLSAWEEAFLASMADLLRRFHGKLVLSEKQAAVLLRIQDKATATLVPGVEDEPELEDLISQWEGD